MNRTRTPGTPPRTQCPRVRGPVSRFGDTRVPRARAALELAAPLWGGGERASAVLDAAERLEPDTDAVLVHGDLNLRHALVSESGGLAGVIDWGDMCRAPRSVDLPLYWSLFDAVSRAVFRAAYGSVTEDTLARARVLALFFDATLAVCGLPS